MQEQLALHEEKGQKVEQPGVEQSLSGPLKALHVSWKETESVSVCVCGDEQSFQEIWLPEDLSV